MTPSAAQVFEPGKSIGVVFYLKTLSARSVRARMASMSIFAVPRTRGDDPMWGALEVVFEDCSPHARG